MPKRHEIFTFRRVGDKKLRAYSVDEKTFIDLNREALENITKKYRAEEYIAEPPKSLKVNVMSETKINKMLNAIKNYGNYMKLKNLKKNHVVYVAAEK